MKKQKYVLDVSKFIDGNYFGCYKNCIIKNNLMIVYFFEWNCFFFFKLVIGVI